MDLKQIKELMTAMEKAGIKKLSIKEKTGFEVQLERQVDEPSPPPSPPPQYASLYHSAILPFREQETHQRLPTHPMSTGRSVSESPAAEKIEEKAEGRYVISPMVGTLYSSPSPDDPPFVKVGDRIEENTVVCIIEAMKVMNEVKAGVSGVVAEIYIENAHPVEFGSKIFRIV